MANGTTALYFVILIMEFSVTDVLPNITFKASRSGGKGGQNVNKVSSKVELNFDFQGSELFDDTQRDLLRNKLANRMTAVGTIQIISEEERSQYLNKERCVEKLLVLLSNALHLQKPRKKTKPRKSAIEQRLKNKQQKALKKINRKKGGFDY